MPFYPDRLFRPKEGTPRSIFGEIVTWMLLAFAILWPISVVVFYKMASVLADQPYDAALAESVRAIARQVQVGKSGLLVDFPVPPQTLLRDDGKSVIQYQVLGPRREHISGDRELPLGALPSDVQPGRVYFRDDELRGRSVRIGFQFVRLDSEPPEWAQVQVAETREKRDAMSSRIIAGVLLPQFAMLPLAVLLVYLGLRRGLSPLTELEQLIEQRASDDLSPVGLHRVPREITSLISSFNAMMDRLDKNIRAQKRFLEDAAHQLRTPLAGLKMQTELAVSECDPEQLAKMLPSLATSANRACHLVNQLLLLARAEASQGDTRLKRQVDLQSVVIETASNLVPAARAKKIQLEIERSNNPLIVEGNPLLLAEMIKNLLDNAIKYTPTGGSVVVRLVHGSEAVVEIQDNGIGIPKADAERIFERFYRVLGTGAEGSGLGLSIVKEIADRHSARVSLAENHQGPGCLARVCLPLAALTFAPNSSS